MTQRSQEVFAALSDPTRRAIFQRLNEDGPATATELTSTYPISRQAISKHLAQLDAAGLVTRSPQGRETVYQAEPAGLGDLATWMKEVDIAWSQRLRRLKKTVEDRGSPH